jgi:hypothetical protein
MAQQRPITAKGGSIQSDVRCLKGDKLYTAAVHFAVVLEELGDGSHDDQQKLLLSRLQQVMKALRCLIHETNFG